LVRAEDSAAPPNVKKFSFPTKPVLILVFFRYGQAKAAKGLFTSGQQCAIIWGINPLEDLPDDIPVL